MRQLQKLITELLTLDRELARFEERYGLLSETFFEWYQSGTEPDDPAWVQDFALWAGPHELKLRRQKKYHPLTTETLVARDVPALMRESLQAVAI